MSKVKVKVIKGPNFPLVEQKAYGVLHEILLEKSVSKDKRSGKIS
jgi:hypothetical protein